MIIIETRKLREVNTDPQRRCYNGAHFSSEMQWDPWDWLELDVKPEQVEERLEFWRDLNKVSATKSEYRAVEREKTNDCL